MACIKKNTVFCILFLALYAVFCRVEALDQCYYDSGCSYLQHCCERKFPEDNVCRFSCIGESCAYDSDCAPSECCDSDNKCTTTCVGKSCTYNGDCATGEYCCDYNERCETSCTVKSCTYDGDCASGECCDSDNKCTTGDCNVLKGLANWIVAVIVIGVVVVIGISIAVVVFFCFCPAAPAVVSTRPNHFRQPCPNQPPPYQPQVKVYPPEASGPPMILPHAEVKE